MLLIRARWLITGAEETDPVLDDGAVAVDGGRVCEVGSWTNLRERYPDAAVAGTGREALIPGLINAHHHGAGATHQQHGVADDLLEPWILALRQQRVEDPHLAILLSAARLLASGVTAVVDVRSGGGTAEQWSTVSRAELAAYERTGIRVAYASGIRTRSHLVAGEDDAFVQSLPADLQGFAQRLLPAPGAIGEADYFAIQDELAAEWRAHPRVDIWFGPPGPQWVSDAFMQQIAERAQALDTGVQTHAAESFYEKLHGPRDFGKPVLVHLRDLGVLSPRYSIAHGVWLGEEEIDVLRETGTSVCHNPGSNLRLRAGIAPLNAFLAGGANVALGMDATSLNDDEDYFAEMRLALRLNRTPRLDAPAPAVLDVFRMATAGGATVLRRGHELGRIAPGYLADLVLLDVERLSWPWVSPEADPRELVLMRAKPSDVRTVFVGGEAVWRDGAPTGFDLEAAGAEFAAQLSATPRSADEDRLVAALQPELRRHYAGWQTPPLRPFTAWNSRD
ncbi:MAG: amidohydrolase family protein [Gammaproteobacteria bacterium]